MLGLSDCSLDFFLYRKLFFSILESGFFLYRKPKVLSPANTTHIWRRELDVCVVRKVLCVKGWSWTKKVRSDIVGKETYASRPTDVISTPLTVRIRFAMTLTVSTRVVRGAPDKKIVLCSPESIMFYDLRSQQSSSESHIPPGECHFIQLQRNACHISLDPLLCSFTFLEHMLGHRCIGHFGHSHPDPGLCESKIDKVCIRGIKIDNSENACMYVE